METVEQKKPPRPRRSFTPEFKAEVVELVRQPGKTVGGVARDLDLTETAVRAWVRQADIDDGRRSDGPTSAELAEMAQLHKELREAREERDILKRAVLSATRQRNSSWSLEAGVANPKVFLGREFRRAATSSSYSWVTSASDPPFGKYCRKRPLVFSFVPRCHGLLGSQK